ncbi:hypothetical protein B0W47_00615 [Komagataeibacter nataicola]|nr:YdaU family protein [Komagataeibacter nataicola]AQU86204.1 hypothetical protein B0W47_00615 [Komagataeibacter nataicola]WNM08392.1 YdaU family protein [Komagataeibacter nataicola]GBR23062.1 hypothetical protein AA0616_2433 [Komagataeibacter nataicola NRIC 0616]
MTDLPEPLTPEYCDLRGYDFMPLFGHRLFSSEFYTEASDAEFRAGMRLWWAAWNQLPAGSLPNSDRALATLADFGRDVKAWQAVKERALHGFILCSDGRLYHPMLCQEALDAYEERLRKSKKRLKDKERLQAWREMRRKQNGDAHQSEEQSNDEMEVKRVSSEFQGHIRNACVAENARGDRDRDSYISPSLRSGSSSSPSAEAVGSRAAEFDEFWAAYPRKVDKGSAMKAHTKARTKTPQSEIMLGLSRHVAAWPDRKSDHGFDLIPYPASWLNAMGWAGDPEASAAARKHANPHRVTRNTQGAPSIWDAVLDHPGV